MRYARNSLLFFCLLLQVIVFRQWNVGHVLEPLVESLSHLLWDYHSYFFVVHLRSVHDGVFCHEHKLFLREVFPELLVVLLQDLVGRGSVVGFVQQFRLFVALLLVADEKAVQVLLLRLQRLHEQLLPANFSQRVAVLAHIFEHLLVHRVKLLNHRTVRLHWNGTN